MDLLAAVFAHLVQLTEHSSLYGPFGAKRITLMHAHCSYLPSFHLSHP